MRKPLNRGASNLDGIMALIVLIFIIVAFVLPGKSPTPLVRNTGSEDGAYSSYSSSDIDYSGVELTRNSPFSGRISIGLGNASYAYQPNEEYITLTNRSNEPLNITGWQLMNAKDERSYDLGGNLRRFTADIALIPRGTIYIRPDGSNVLENIVLAPGDSAVITTGSMGSRTPYQIVSFKENICSGYLQSMPEYSFTPALTRSCPRPTAESGVRSLDASCRQFIDRLSVCRTPEFGGRDRSGDPCPSCVDGSIQSSSCINFLKERFTYAGCVATHSSNPNFSGNTWRVFLNQGWELWANDHDIIKIYDSSGRLVDYRIY